MNTCRMSELNYRIFSLNKIALLKDIDKGVLMSKALILEMLHLLFKESYQISDEYDNYIIQIVVQQK